MIKFCLKIIKQIIPESVTKEQTNTTGSDDNTQTVSMDADVVWYYTCLIFLYMLIVYILTRNYSFTFLIYAYSAIFFQAEEPAIEKNPTVTVACQFSFHPCRRSKYCQDSISSHIQSIYSQWNLLFLKGCQTDFERKQMVDAYANVTPSCLEKKCRFMSCSTSSFDDPVSSPITHDSNDETYTPNVQRKRRMIRSTI